MDNAFLSNRLGTLSPAEERLDGLGRKSPSQSRPYRSKKIAPCDACRTRRVACLREEETSPCSLCRHRGQGCTFLSIPERRDKRVSTGKQSRSQAPSRPRSAAPRQRRIPLPPEVGKGFEASSTGTTSVPGWTCLLSGLSGDQNPHLLRHLAFNTSDLFGTRRWMVWRVDPRLTGAAYLTIYPNEHLDYNLEMYEYDKINKIFGPYQDELIDLYYAYVHPSYPILQKKEPLLAARDQNRIPSSLLAVVYSLGCKFWTKSAALQQSSPPNATKLRPYIFSMLTVEARTPNIHVLQAILLYMQLGPVIIRATNHPGFWALTTLAVAIAQDIGLHVDPGSWKISSDERKLRRILWWSVYIHDKWMAHWLGRPSHIVQKDWAVKTLTLHDFSNAEGMLSTDEVSQGLTFIALCTLTEILSDVLESFYSIRSNFEQMDVHSSTAKTNEFLNRLQSWKQQNGYLHLPDSRTSSSYTTILAAFTVEILIRNPHISTFRSAEDVEGNTQMTSMMKRVSHTICDILEHRPQESKLWLSYNTGNLMTIGSQLIALVLASTDDDELKERRDVLLKFRGHLVELAKDERDFDFARLPLRRLNLIILELFGEDDEIAKDVDPVDDDDESGILGTAEICEATFWAAMNHVTP